MKPKVLELLVAVSILSATASASAAPGRKILIPPPPPTVNNTPAPAAAPAKQAWTTGNVSVVVPLVTHVAPGTKVQRFNDNWVLKKNQGKLPLELTVMNGIDGKPAYSWFRIKSNGQLIASEKTLKRKTKAVLDVSGQFTEGANSFTIEAAGQPGAELSWTIDTPAMKVLTVTPAVVRPGEMIILKGTNFPTNVNVTNAIVGDKTGDVVATTTTSMVVKVPEESTPGKATLYLDAYGLPSISVPLAIAGSPSPVLKRSDSSAGAPGEEIVLQGKFFSKNASQNQVLFNGVAGQVRSATDTSLTVVVPSVSNSTKGPTSVPITVISNGLACKTPVSFTIGKQNSNPTYVPSVTYGDRQNSQQGSFGERSSTYTGRESGSTGNSFQASSQQGVMPDSSSGGFLIRQTDEHF